MFVLECLFKLDDLNFSFYKTIIYFEENFFNLKGLSLS